MTNSPKSIPKHVAFIMDGNGRWANSKGLPVISGHQNGSKTVRMVLEKSVEMGVKYVTLYAFSSENWKRPKEWITELMGLFKYYLKSELATLHKQGVKLKFIGERAHLSKNLNDMIDHAEALTKENAQLVVNIALSYGSQQEILRACKTLMHKTSTGELNPDDLTIEMFENHLDTKECPNPDLLIRTSGEQRLSNFLLWQLAYAEFIFLDCYWPDFTAEAYESCLYQYTHRERRFGTTNYNA
jgi:undecaprenyl diphosphate synthase